jgi:hypothetical protein
MIRPQQLMAEEFESQWDKEIGNMATPGRFDMANWTKGPVSLSEAFGVTKGTIKYPKLTAELPAEQQQATTATNTGPAGGGNAAAPTGKQAASNAALGQQMAAAQPYNWTGTQWDDLNNIVMAESGWSTTAENASGAYGIPQALPGSKMASSGANWQTSAATQIAWMLQYIQQRYGTPAVAWRFHLANGWY